MHFLPQKYTLLSTVLVLRMAHRKWKETKQQPSMLPGPAVPGSCLVSFHILWAILSTSTVLLDQARAPQLCAHKHTKQKQVALVSPSITHGR